MANYKAGGEGKLGNVTFKIQQKTKRADPAKGVDGRCGSSYKFLLNGYEVWGHGFASDDFGENLKNQLKGCACFRIPGASNTGWEMTGGSGRPNFARVCSRRSTAVMHSIPLEGRRPSGVVRAVVELGVRLELLSREG